MRGIGRFLGLLSLVGLLALQGACNGSPERGADTAMAQVGPPDHVARGHLKEVPDSLKAYTLRVNRFEDRLSRGLCALTRVVFDSLKAPDYGNEEGSWRFCRPDAESPDYPPPPDPITDPWGDDWEG